MRAFLKRKNIEISFERYLIDAMGAMAMGLFATLITGVILRTIGEQVGISFLTDVLGPEAVELGGAGIAIAVAMSLQAPKLVIYGSVINGMIGSALGGPVGAFIAAVVGAEFGKAIAGETSVDVVLTPIVTMLTGSLVGYWVGGPIDQFMRGVGQLIIHATELQPLFMGMFVAVIMAILLVMPTSSTAIVIMIHLSGLATGATAVGCCAVCVGFGVMSYRENGMKGIWAQIPGSPMIQVANIIRNPLVLLPPAIAAAVVGGLSTTLMKVTCLAAASGTGTSGFVTPLGIYSDMISRGEPLGSILLKILVLCFLLPAVITWVVGEGMRKINWIKFGDLKLDI